MGQDIRAGRIVISEAELEERFVRASGPGGQNVNKVSTAVELRFDAANSPVLDEALRTRLLRLAGSRATSDGVILIRAERYRTQERNREDARERLGKLLERALTPPKPRKKTRPTRASKERRLDSKQRRASVKKARGKPTSAKKLQERVRMFARMRRPFVAASDYVGPERRKNPDRIKPDDLIEVPNILADKAQRCYDPARYRQTMADTLTHVRKVVSGRFADKAEGLLAEYKEKLDAGETEAAAKALAGLAALAAGLEAHAGRIGSAPLGRYAGGLAKLTDAFRGKVSSEAVARNRRLLEQAVSSIAGEARKHAG